MASVPGIRIRLQVYPIGGAGMTNSAIMYQIYLLSGILALAAAINYI